MFRIHISGAQRAPSPPNAREGDRSMGILRFCSSVTIGKRRTRRRRTSLFEPATRYKGKGGPSPFLVWRLREITQTESLSGKEALMSSLPPAGGRRRHDSGGRAKKWPKLLVKRRSVSLLLGIKDVAWVGGARHATENERGKTGWVAANHPLIHFPFTFGGMGYPRRV